MIFIDDVYSQEYYNIVSLARVRANTKKEALSVLEYTEKHHIIPKSFHVVSSGKSAGWINENSEVPDNLVYLSAAEHYRCHWLLAIMTLRDRDHAALARYKMVCALHMMTSTRHRNSHYLIQEEEYAHSKILFSQRVIPSATIEKIRKANTGRKASDHTKEKQSNAKKGIKLSDEAKAKRKELMADYVVPPGSVTQRIETRKNNGTPWHSAETKVKIGVATSNPSAETRKRLSDKNIGKKHTEETKKKLSDIHLAYSQEKKATILEKRKATIEKNGTSNNGRKHTLESIQKMRDAKKGCTGREWTQEQKDKSAATRKRNKFLKQQSGN
jgi:hypothetical protein